MRTVQKLLMPGGLILLGALLIAHGIELPERVPQLARIVPSLIYAAAILLGARFHSAQMVLGLVALAIIDATLAFFAPRGVSPSHLESDLTIALVFLLPLNFALLSVRPPRTIFELATGARLALLLLVPLVIGWLAIESPGLLTSLLDQRWVDIDPVTGTGLSQPAWVAFVFALVLFPVQQIFGRSAMSGGMFWALAAALLALHAAPQSPGTVVFLAAAGAILIVSQVENNYLLAFRDDLTELPSRRALDQALSRLGKHYTIAMLDIDHFKNFNDSYGHQVGDQLLRMISFKLAGLTGGGTAFRYGGEEFALLFPGKHLREAVPHIKGAMEAIRSTSFAIRGPGRHLGPKAAIDNANEETPQTVSVTVSIGVSATRSPDEILGEADQAVYMAKNGGRDQMVVVSDDSQSLRPRPEEVQRPKPDRATPPRRKPAARKKQSTKATTKTT
jgi:diguanylate cyclase (GGDEF)-like protein